MSSDTPSIWFMFDNHTFRKIQSGWPDRAIFNELRACFDEDGSGHVFVRHWPDGPIEKTLELDAYAIRPGQYFVTDDEITDWIKRFRAFRFDQKPPTVEELQRDLTTAQARIAELEGALREVVEMWEEYSAGSDIGIAGTAYAMRSAARRALERRLA